MNCKNCGSLLNQNDEYCYNCGNKVDFSKEDRFIKAKNSKSSKFLAGCLFVFLVFFLIYVFFLRNVFNFFDRNGSFYGDWYLYNDGDVSTDDYLKIKDDGTFLWGASGFGIYSGNYDYEYGFEKNDGKPFYFSDEYTFYTLTLHPKTLTKEDGTVLTKTFYDAPYVIGISKDGKMMYAIHLKTYNRSYLIKQ